MKKLQALLIAICLILAILIFNIPDINHGLGLSQVIQPVVGSVHEYIEKYNRSG